MVNRKRSSEAQELEARKEVVINILSSEIEALKKQDWENRISKKEVNEKLVGEIKDLENILKQIEVIKVNEKDSLTLLEGALTQVQGLQVAKEQIKNTKEELEKSEEFLTIGSKGSEATEETKLLKGRLEQLEHAQGAAINNLRKILDVEKSQGQAMQADTFKGANRSSPSEETKAAVKDVLEMNGWEKIPETLMTRRKEGDLRIYSVQVSDKSGSEFTIEVKRDSNDHFEYRKKGESQWKSVEQTKNTVEEVQRIEVNGSEYAVVKNKATQSKQVQSKNSERPRTQYTELDWSANPGLGVIHKSQGSETEYATIQHTAPPRPPKNAPDPRRDLKKPHSPLIQKKERTSPRNGRKI